MPGVRALCSLRLAGRGPDPVLPLELPLVFAVWVLDDLREASASLGVAHRFLDGGSWHRGWKGESQRGGNRALAGPPSKVECSRHKVFLSLMPQVSPCSYLSPCRLPSLLSSRFSSLKWA